MPAKVKPNKRFSPGLYAAFGDEDVQAAFDKMMLWRGHCAYLGGVSFKQAMKELEDLLWQRYKLSFEEYT